MSDQPRRRASRNMSRRERRTSGVRSYTVPSSASYTSSAAPRRSYMAEPAPVDYSTEYRHVRHDLFRILIWASLLIIAMIALAFSPIFG